MPESIFGRPSHLLPPVQATSSPPPNIHDLHFQTIGKQPALLSRISQADPTVTYYPSPSPPPTSSSSIATNNLPAQSSRPSLFQKLGGASTTTTAHASYPATSTVSYTPSITSSNPDIPAAASTPSGMMTGSPKHIPPPRPRINLAKNTVEFRDAPSGATLIPPTGILPQESSRSGPSTSNHPQGKSLETNIPSFPPSAPSRDDVQTEVVAPHPATTPGPAQQPFTEQPAVDDGLAMPFGSCAPDSHTPSRLPTPPSVPTPPCNHLLISPTHSVEGSTVSDSHVGESSQQPSTLVDAISMCEVHLLAARNDLSMAMRPEDAACIPLPPPSPSTMETRDLSRGNESPPREEPRPLQLSDPFLLRDQPSSTNLDHPMDADQNALAITPQHSILLSQFQAQANHFFEIVQGLTSAIDAVHRSHTEVENTLTQQQRCLTEQRSALRAVEADYQAQLQHLNHSREALHQRETALAASEREYRSREEARNVQWQAREEKRCDALKSHLVQVDMCLKELEELKKAREAEQQRYVQPGLLPPVPTHPNLPTEVQEGMNEEEIKTIEERKALIAFVHRLRRVYAQKVGFLERSTNALARLQEEREKRVAEEARQKLLAEEEERARQAAAEEQRKRAAAQAEQEKSLVEAAERHRMPAADGNDSTIPQHSIEKPAHIETQATISNTDAEQHRRQEEFARKRAEVMAQKQQANAENAARIRAAREGLTTAPSEGNNAAAAAAADESRDASAMSPPSIVQRPAETQRHSPSSPKSRKKTVVASGGVMLSTPQGGSSFGPTAARLPTTPGHGKGSIITAKTPSFVSASTEAGRQVATDTPLFPIQLASELNNASSANADVYRAMTPPRQTFALNPKSQTLLEAGGQLDLGPTPRVSPAQHTVNLRHLKKSRSYVEVRGGDRSVINGSVKVEDSTIPSLKKEEDQDLPTLLVQNESRPHSGQQEMNMSQIPPPRLAVIPPPRPKLSNRVAPMRVSSAFDAQNSSGGVMEAQNNVALAPPSHPSRASPNPWVMDASAERQEWAPQPTPSPSPPEVVHFSSQESSSQGHANGGGAGPAEHVEAENRSLITEHNLPRPSPESLTTSLYETDRLRERSKYAHARIDHYSPPKLPSPPFYARRSSGDDRWKARMNSIAIPTRPIVGRKRRSESVDDDYSYRSRRARTDERVPYTYKVDPRGGPLRARSPSPSEYHRYQPRSPSTDYHGSGTNPWVQPEPYVPLRDPLPRIVDDTDPTDRYHRRPAPAFSPAPHFPTREQEIRQDTEDQVEGQQDPSLLARMSDRQRFPLPAHSRVRGKTDWGKSRDTGVLGGDDTGRGRGERGRSNVSRPPRNGARLIERLTEEPITLEERLT